MELALNKTLAGKKLPEGSVIVSAVNEGDEYQLTDLDPALVSRFNLYHFAPSGGRLDAMGGRATKSIHAGHFVFAQTASLSRQ